MVTGKVPRGELRPADKVAAEELPVVLLGLKVAPVPAGPEALSAMAPVYPGVRLMITVGGDGVLVPWTSVAAAGLMDKEKPSIILSVTGVEFDTFPFVPVILT